MERSNNGQAGRPHGKMEVRGGLFSLKGKASELGQDISERVRIRFSSMELVMAVNIYGWLMDRIGSVINRFIHMFILFNGYI